MKKKNLLSVLLIALLVVVSGCSSNTGTETGTAYPENQITIPGVNIQLPGANIEVVWPGPNPLINTTDARNRTAGVLVGIWHGIISPITLVLSFINPDVQMVEVHNDGSPYNLGFLLGVGLVFLLLGAFAGSRRH